MPIIVLASAAGSPGVTTTALGLTLAWHRDALMVDADREPSQAVLAGYLGGAPAVGLGMSGLARLYRENRPLGPELLRNCLALDQDRPGRYFLPGFSHPGSPQLFQSVWGELAVALRAAESRGIDTIVDAGRLGEGLPPPLLAHTDAVLVASRTSLRALSAVRLHLPVLQRRTAEMAPGAQVAMTLIGEGHPYTHIEISEQFQVPVWGSIRWQPKNAEVYSDGTPASRRFGQSAFAKSLGDAAATIRQHLSRPRTRLGEPPGP